MKILTIAVSFACYACYADWPYRLGIFPKANMNILSPNWPANSMHYWPGRLAFPVFAFCIAEGYRRSRDVSKYMRRLGAAGSYQYHPFLSDGLLVWLIMQNTVVTLFWGSVLLLQWSATATWRKSIILIVLPLVHYRRRTDGGVFASMPLKIKDPIFRKLAVSGTEQCANPIWSSILLWWSGWSGCHLSLLSPRDLFYNGQRGPH